MVQNNNLNQLVMGPILLSPNHFADIQRTPWAGKKIAKLYKGSWVADGASIGESWEVSCDPEFPSQVPSIGKSLITLVEKFPDQIMGAKNGGDGFQILLKLVNAADPLSFQVHPLDNDKSLMAQECGKYESWYILDADPGSGIYLGFSGAMTKKRFKELVESGEDIRRYLQFIPVAAGDFFDISPGTPHAIGAGVTLLEPQRILPGKSGKTYRLWDWGRGRELHLGAGLAVIDPERQSGPDFVAEIRRPGKSIKVKKGVAAKVFPANKYYQLSVIEMEPASHCEISCAHGYAAGILLEGNAAVFGQTELKFNLQTGQPFVWPNAAFPGGVFSANQSTLALVTLAGAPLQLR